MARLVLALLGIGMIFAFMDLDGDYPVQFFDMCLPGPIGKDKALGETLFALRCAVGCPFLGVVVLHVGEALRHKPSRRICVSLKQALVALRRDWASANDNDSEVEKGKDCLAKVVMTGSLGIQTINRIYRMAKRKEAGESAVGFAGLQVQARERVCLTITRHCASD
jgi:hypothetical protein